MRDDLYTLTVLRGLLKNKVISTLAALLNTPKTAVEKSDAATAEFFSAVLEEGCENRLSEYADELILTDENPFSRRCATGTPSERLLNAFYRDVRIVRNAVEKGCLAGGFKEGSRIPPFFGDVDKTVGALSEFYKKSGYGIFIRNSAFRYSEGKLVPISAPTRVTLSELKDYAEEKEIVGKNIEGFLNGLPALDMLLYGDRGTGKSSTVHAMLDKYCSSGLRIIELDSDSLTKINEVRQLIRNIPLKFIIFIDDLSFVGDDSRISSVKASLEGSLSGGKENSMIIVTSNRRHVVKENFTDRQDAVHASDAMDEQLSLSDRFGLTVLFSTTGKESYLSIVEQLAADVGLNIEMERLFALAERWALAKGGRSPRHAKQFVDLAYSLTSRGLTIDF